MTMERTLPLVEGDCTVLDLPAILGDLLPRLPYVLRFLAENHIRTTGETAAVKQALEDWLAGRPSAFEFTFQSNRILMHDTTCTPALADIAGLRDALAEAAKDPALLSPQLPVEVPVDHSIGLGYRRFGSRKCYVRPARSPRHVRGGGR